MSHRLALAAAAAAPVMLLCAASPALAQSQNPWNGFYVGLNLGGTWGDLSNTARVAPGSGPVVIPPADVAAINSVAQGNAAPGGFSGGVEGGYNHITGSGLLLGIETDWGAMDVSKNGYVTVNSTVQTAPQMTYSMKSHANTDWVWTLRPRLGFVTGNWLLYGTLGMAVTDIKSELTYVDSTTRTAAFSDNDTKTGWIGGLGAGYAFAPGWSVKGEWLYADFGKVNGNAASSDGFVKIGSEGLMKTNMFRVGIDYRF